MPKKWASKSQAKAMFAAKEGKSTIGIPQKVGAQAVQENKGKSMKDLPEKVSKKK